MRRRNESDVCAEFLEDVGETRWNRNSAVHREAQTVCLTMTVIRILTEDDDPGPRERCRMQRAEHLVVGWIHGTTRTFACDEFLKILPVLLFEFGTKYRVPIGVHPARK